MNERKFWQLIKIASAEAGGAGQFAAALEELLSLVPNVYRAVTSGDLSSLTRETIAMVTDHRTEGCLPLCNPIVYRYFSA